MQQVIRKYKKASQVADDGQQQWLISPAAIQPRDLPGNWPFRGQQMLSRSSMTAGLSIGYGHYHLP